MDDPRHELSDKVAHAAEMIGEALSKTLTEMRPTFSEKYGIDEQLATLAIARATVNIAVTSACQAAGMTDDECRVLERQVNDVIHKAMLKAEGGE